MRANTSYTYFGILILIVNLKNVKIVPVHIIEAYEGVEA
jgi:hypothetical protein